MPAAFSPFAVGGALCLKPVAPQLPYLGRFPRYLPSLGVTANWCACPLLRFICGARPSPGTEWFAKMSSSARHAIDSGAADLVLRLTGTCPVLKTYTQGLGVLLHHTSCGAEHLPEPCALRWAILRTKCGAWRGIVLHWMPCAGTPSRVLGEFSVH